MLRKAEKELEKGDPTYFCEVDAILHNLIITSAGNLWLTQIMSQLRDLVEMTKNIFTSLERYKESLHDHIAIVESLLREDKAAAIKNLNLHMEHVKHRLLVSFQQDKEMKGEDLLNVKRSGI